MAFWIVLALILLIISLVRHMRKACDADPLRDVGLVWKLWRRSCSASRSSTFFGLSTYTDSRYLFRFTWMTNFQRAVNSFVALFILSLWCQSDRLIGQSFHHMIFTVSNETDFSEDSQYWHIANCC